MYVYKYIWHKHTANTIPGEEQASVAKTIGTIA